MPARVHRLDENPEDHEMLQDTFRHLFLHGECYAFAAALSEGLGWPIVGLMKGDTVWHAGVRHPDGRIHDIRGALTEEEFARPYPEAPRIFRTVTFETLCAIRPVHERMIRRARRTAEALWPELPWKDSFQARVEAFATDLEELSRKHKLWIVAGVPANPPRLFEGHDDEGGYELRPTIDGAAYTITRYFE